ncbi:phage tail tape measure C-terminal domain-containing protein [Paraburkholderia aspalathi]|uniref:Phage tail tape measure protein, lambda family n=1 Tax=Paraburkholderia aspalathi TaxID=1324617 RepID=A0A1I7EFJ6_9BURK|nr:phage tail tape measure C-terminal domain-containing protein [Paraburkholderia aspalathi]SFU22709.1 phage tail tape measure protein, lambda family [Paraburkholderia aspalathi]
MSSNNEVKTKFTADSSGFTAAVDKANQRISAYAASTGRAREVLENFQGALEESGAATSKQVQQIAQAVMQMDKMASTAGKTKAELASMRAESLGISSAMKSYISDIDAATSHTHSFSLANASAQRELLVLAHELSQGNFKKFGGSLMVLANQANAMSLILNPVALGIGAVVGTAALSAEVVHKAAEQMETYADTVQKLSQQTGQSTKQIQEWSYATQSVGLDAKDSAKAIEALGDAQNKAIAGNKNAVNAFTALGISMQQVKAESPHDMLLDVANAFQQSQDSAAKAAVAHELFGEAGEKLIPLLDKGSSGIAEYTDKANALGGVLSDNTIKQLAAMKEHTEEAHAEWEAMTMHAKAQLIPAIEAITSAFSDNSAMGPIVDQFYAGVLETFRVVATAAATVVTGLNQVGTSITMLSKMSNDLGKGSWSAVMDDAKNGYDELKRQGDSYAAFTKKLWDDQKSLATPHMGPTGDKQIHYAKGEKSPKKGNENELNGQIAELNTQLKGIDDSRKEHLENLKSDFDKGLLDYRDYYVQVIATNEGYYKQEEAIQEKRLELAKQKKNIAAAQSAQQELNRIEHERVLAAQKASGDLGKEWQKRADATVKYAEQEAAATRGLAQSYADGDAQRFMLPRQRTDYTGEIKLLNAYYQDVAKLREQYDSKQIDQQSYDDRTQIAAQAYADREALYAQHLANEQAIRESYEAQIHLAIVGIGSAGKTNAQYVGEAFSSVWGSMSSALDQFVTTGKLNFSQFASSVLADMAKIALHAAEMQIFQSVASSWSGFSTGGSVGHFADGGHITGPGTGTSDSIPAMLSNGEFVVNAAAAGKHRSLLESINSGQAAHFASGGAVGNAPSSSSDSGSGSGDLHFHLDGSGRGGGLSAQDAKEMLPIFQAIVDKRMDQKMRGQGGYAYQQKYGQI